MGEIRAYYYVMEPAKEKIMVQKTRDYDKAKEEDTRE